MKPGQPTRRDYEYKRNGTRNLFIFVEPQAGFRHVLITRRRTQLDFSYAMRTWHLDRRTFTREKAERTFCKNLSYSAS